MPKFTQTIYKVGINPCVEVPRRVSDDLGKTGYVPVIGKLDGHAFRSTLVPVGSGRHRLYVNGEMRRQAGVGVGDKVAFEVELDEKSRDLPLPEPLAMALEANPKARARFESYSPSARREILAYLSSLKRSQTLVRNIDRLIARLESEES